MNQVVYNNTSIFLLKKKKQHFDILLIQQRVLGADQPLYKADQIHFE